MSQRIHILISVLWIGFATAAAIAQTDDKAQAKAEPKSKPAVKADKPAIDAKADAIVRKAFSYLSSQKRSSATMLVKMLMETPEEKQEQLLRIGLAIEAPDKALMNTQNNDLLQTYLTDGKSNWVYMSKTNSYLIEDASKAGPQSATTRIGISPKQLLSFLKDGLDRQIMPNIKTLTYEGTEKIDDVQCHKIRFTMDLVKMLANPLRAVPPGAQMAVDVWIRTGDKPLLERIVPDYAALMKASTHGDPVAEQRFAKMKIQMSVVAKDWKFNDQIPAETFVFQPPKDSRKVTTFAQLMEGPHPLLDKPAPEIDLVLLDGKKLKLTDHQQKNVVILDFWATWCGPCVDAMPILTSVAAEYKDKGVVLYAVNQREMPAQIKNFLAQQKWSVTVAMDPQGLIGNAYAVTGIPQTVIIDKTGKVRNVHIGFNPNMRQQLRDELNEILGIKATTGKSK